MGILEAVVIRATLIALALALATPARAGWSIVCAPETNLEQLDLALIGA